jgi:GTP1/Obg family GTP-binding protein
MNEQNTEDPLPGPIGQPRRVRQSRLLNQAQVRRFILDTIRRPRPHLRLCRVSQEALDQIETWLRQRIRAAVAGHPSVGKTFKPL